MRYIKWGSTIHAVHLTKLWKTAYIYTKILKLVELEYASNSSSSSSGGSGGGGSSQQAGIRSF